MAEETKELIKQREHSYGTFHTGAALTQVLYGTLVKHYTAMHAEEENPRPLPPFMAEGLHAICGKLSRIINGDPYFIDSWRDVGGFATRVAEILSTVDGASDVVVRRVINNKGTWHVDGEEPKQAETINSEQGE